MMVGRILGIKEEDNKITIEIETGNPTPSSTGKMNFLFSTGGWQRITPKGLRGLIMLGMKAETKK